MKEKLKKKRRSLPPTPIGLVETSFGALWICEPCCNNIPNMKKKILQVFPINRPPRGYKRCQVCLDGLDKKGMKAAFFDLIEPNPLSRSSPLNSGPWAGLWIEPCETYLKYKVYDGEILNRTEEELLSWIENKGRDEELTEEDLWDLIEYD